jgi:PhzF family phenazine biosynthesis protein
LKFCLWETGGDPFIVAMKLTYVTLDVFTSTAYYGNPLAIVNIPAEHALTLMPEKLQLIAREFNFSETVFLHEQSAEDAREGLVRIQINTPWAEIPFAGHPTVGTTNYLLRYLKHENFKVLVTKAGRIVVKLNEGGEDVSLEVAHNVKIHAQPFTHPVLGAFPVVSIVKGMSFIVAKMPDLETLAKQNKSFRENSYVDLDGLDEGWQVGLLATYYYVDLGIDESGTRQIRTRCLSMGEDPATGSAASALTCYLALQERPVDRTIRFKVTQGVEMGRKSDISVEVTKTSDGKAIEKVVLSGTAVKIMEGSLEAP